jgi:Response regulator of citrate/malate metabolism
MLNVLIVEDDPMVAAINRQYLEKTEGFSFAGAVARGSDALDFLCKTQVSLVLLDVFMPGLDGLSLLKEIRKNHPAVDVVMVTAARSSADIQTALRLGVIDYIVKPFTFERFQTALIAYRERMRLLHSEEELSQEILDKRILPAKQQPAPHSKNIDSATLKLVCGVLAGLEGEFNSKDVVPLVGISRVSLKKYLEHLEAEGLIRSRLVYMPVGRPVTTYCWTGGTKAG